MKVENIIRTVNCYDDDPDGTLYIIELSSTVAAHSFTRTLNISRSVGLLDFESSTSFKASSTSSYCVSPMHLLNID